MPYTDKQIEPCACLSCGLADVTSIVVRDGLIAEIKKQAPQSLDLTKMPTIGKNQKGMWTTPT